MYNKFVSKKTKKILSAVLATALVVTAMPAFEAEAAAKKNTISDKKVTIALGKSKKITVKNKTKGAKVTFKTTKKSVATVTKKGTIKAKKKGNATIKVTVKKGKKTLKKLTCKVKVINGAKKVDITTNKGKTITITQGKTKQLKAKLYKKAGKKSHGDKVTWSSKNKKIATVTSKGKVKAVKAGTTYIYAKTISGKKDKIKIKVVKKATTTTPAPGVSTPTPGTSTPTPTPGTSTPTPVAISATITVKVTDVSGTAITGADIDVKDEAGKVVATASSISTGNAIKLENGNYVVSAKKDGYVAATQAAVVKGEAFDVNLKLKAEASTEVPTSAAVTVNVKDAKNVVVTGATIEVKADGKVVTSASSVSAGKVFELANGSYEVSAKKDGYKVATENITVAGKATSVSLVLEEEASTEVPTSAAVTVNVKDKAGVAVTGAEVTVKTAAGKTVATGTSLATGNVFVLENGEYVVSAQKEGYEVAIGAALVKEGKATSVDLILKAKEQPSVPTGAAVTVNVQDATGSAVTGAVITIKAADGTPVATGESLTAGNVFDLVNGDYKVEVAKEGYKKATAVISIKDGVAVNANIKVVLRLVDDVTVATSAALTVSVTASGKAITGASIEITKVTGGSVATGESLEAGNIFVLENGDYVVTVQKEGYQVATAPAIVVGEDIDVTIMLKENENPTPVSSVITFGITNATGTAVTGATIVVKTASGDAVETVTGATVTLVEGSYTAEVTKDGYKTATKAFVVGAVAKTVEIELEVE